MASMTRAEARKQKIRDEETLIASMKGMPVDSKTKGEFRKTSMWKEFRNRLKKERKVDAITGRKLTKTWNLHHMRFDPRKYTDLEEEYFMCLNNQMHDLLHVCVSETIKDPAFMERLNRVVKEHIKLNGGKDVRQWTKDLRK